MKVSTSSKKEPKSKLGKNHKKVEGLKIKISELRKEKRIQRKRLKSMEKSRDSWKSKNKEKANRIKGLQKRIKREDKPKRHHYGIKIILLCVMLRLKGGCSYRSIRRVLEALEYCKVVLFQRIPCANTVKNWVSKLGLYQLENAMESTENKEIGVIIDENLKAGNERVMLMLFTPSKKEKTGALGYEDTDVFYIGGKKSWTGENIAEQIRELMEDSRLEVTHILSDEDSKLRKATRLLEVPHLPDINHAVAKCLRKTFKNNEEYQAMIKLISGYSSKCVNQELTYLRPPKQRVKARFMNQKPIIYWGLTILLRFDELNEKEKTFYKGLKTHQAMLNKLKVCIELSEQAVKPLKEKGLSLATLKMFKQKTKQTKTNHSKDKLIIGFAESLEKYADQYADFLEGRAGCYNVSSDVIESLFGKQKSLANSNPLIGISLLDLELPVHCIAKNKITARIKPALEEIFITSLKTWRATHSSIDQSLARKLFFKKWA